MSDKMKNILKLIVPSIRELNFKGSGQNYYKILGDILCIINFQKSTGGERFYVNMGAYPLVLLGDSELKKIKEYDCMFRERLPPPENEFGWHYETEDWSELIKKLDFYHEAYFLELSNIKETMKNKNINELLIDSENSSPGFIIYGYRNARTYYKFSLLSLSYGLEEKSKYYASKGVSICPERATGLLPKLKALENV